MSRSLLTGVEKWGFVYTGVVCEHEDEDEAG